MRAPSPQGRFANHTGSQSYLQLNGSQQPVTNYTQFYRNQSVLQNQMSPQVSQQQLPMSAGGPVMQPGFYAQVYGQQPGQQRQGGVNDAIHTLMN